MSTLAEFTVICSAFVVLNFVIGFGVEYLKGRRK